jgi:hypothetical protein
VGSRRVDYRLQQGSIGRLKVIHLANNGDERGHADDTLGFLC